MGWLDLVLGQNNGVSRYVDTNKNAIHGAFAGFGQGTNIGDGFGYAARGAAAGAPADDIAAASLKADQERQQQISATTKYLQAKFPDLAAAVTSGLPLSDAWSEAMKRSQPGYGETAGTAPASVQEYQFYSDQEKQAGRSPLSFADWRKGANSTVRAGVGQPIPLKNKATGEYHTFQSMTDGSMVDTMTGKPANADDWTYDPGAINSDRAAGTAVGTAQGGMQFNMPAAKQNIDQELANIDAIAADQRGLDETFGNVGGVSVNGVGWPNQWTPTLPNSAKAGLKTRIDQVVGQNFLQAYASLKGAGAITEVEGGKAQDAMARLGAAQSKADFLKALSDLKQVLADGYARMGTQATTGYQSNGYQPPPLGSGGADPVSAADALLNSGKY